MPARDCQARLCRDRRINDPRMKSKPPPYRAPDGQEDRDGEMTGAISVNMILSMVPVGIWCFFLGPWLAPFWATLTVGLILAIALPICCLPLSRTIWAWLSDWADRF